MYCKIHFYFFERAGSSETISAARPGQAEAAEEPERPGQAEAGGDTKQSATHATRRRSGTISGTISAAAIRNDQ